MGEKFSPRYDKAPDPKIRGPEVTPAGEGFSVAPGDLIGEKGHRHMSLQFTRYALQVYSQRSIPRRGGADLPDWRMS